MTGAVAPVAVRAGITRPAGPKGEARGPNRTVVGAVDLEVPAASVVVVVVVEAPGRAAISARVVEGVPNRIGRPRRLCLKWRCKSAPTRPASTPWHARSK